MRAVLDVGTNSVRLLLARIHSDRVEPLLREVRVTRLGQGTDASGELREDAMVRTLDALGELVALIPPGTPTAIFATSAVRDAKNKGQFVELVREALGLQLEVLSGIAEAELSFRGALASFEGVELADPITVVDIGGGSTEIYTGRTSGELLGGGSLQIGAVRLLERYGDGLPAPEEIAGILLPLAKKNLAFQPQTLVAVGGTATSLAAIEQELLHYDDEQVMGFAFSLGELESCYMKLVRLSLEERRRISSLQAGREDVIVYGAAILVEAARLLGFSRILVSTGDLLTARLLSLEC
ncbi:MAG: Ppx/GppA family phosphatase [Limnochordia bacterium]|nr:Ppx/GppA family phosphatase [Limnochordia bacterium]